MVYDQISYEIGTFYGFTGKRPKSVYIGINQKAALEREYREHGDSFNESQWKMTNRPEIDSIPIYVVDADDHIACSLLGDTI